MKTAAADEAPSLDNNNNNNEPPKPGSGLRGDGVFSTLWYCQTSQNS